MDKLKSIFFSNRKELIENSLKAAIYLCLLFLVIFIFSQKINFTSLDLGRHIKNGEMVFQDHKVLFTNFYSYTETDHPFINHHWLAGVFYYLTFRLGGFEALTVLNIAIAVALMTVGLWLARQKSGFYIAALAALPGLLLLNERTDIRPEMFSYLFLVVLLALIERFEKTGKAKYLYFAVPLQLLWANVHIYFFLGLAVFCSYAALKILMPNGRHFSAKPFPDLSFRSYGASIKSNFKKQQKIIAVAALLALSSLINPNCVNGLLYPLSILRSYGYDIVENKSPFYLEDLTINPNITIYKVFLALTAASYLLAICRKKKIDLFYLGLTLFFGFLSFTAIRNLPLFALAAWIAFADNLASLPQVEKSDKLNVSPAFIFIAAFVALSFWLYSDYSGQRNYSRHDKGLAAAMGSMDALDFFKENNLSGPILNNYDLGSALIFGVYPKEKVFVDNRPEAYSVKFFNEIYKPMLDNEELWEKYGNEYNFNAIVFSHTDGTPWARNFLSKRLKDEKWPLVHVDSYGLIMLAKNELNRDLIAKYATSNEELEKRVKILFDDSGWEQKINLINFAGLSGNSALGLDLIDRFLNDRPNNARALTLKGYYLLYDQRPDSIVRSIDYLNKALAAGYKLPETYNQLGLNYFNLGDISKAKLMWEQSLKMDSDNQHAASYLDQLKAVSR